MGFLRGLLIIPPVAVGVLILYFAVSGKQAPARVEPGEVATAARIITVEPRDFVPRVTGYGTVEPARTWSAIAQVGGHVEFVNPSFVKGGFVGKGDVLVRLAGEEYELQVAQSRANIQSADADIQELKLTAETTKLSLQIEQEALLLSETDLERKQNLVSRGTISQASVDDEKAALLVQKQKVQEKENTLALIPAQMQALEQTKAVNESKLRLAELDLERTTIRAPFDGRVSSADVEVTQYVAAGTTMGAMDGIDAAEIEVQIAPNRMAGFIRLALKEIGGTANGAREMGRGFARMTAIVRLGHTTIPVSWKGSVVRVSDTFDSATRSIGVIVSVPRPYDDLRPGEKPPLVKGSFTGVELQGPVVKDVLLVPRTAIRNDHVFFVDDENRLRTTPVEIVYKFEDLAVLVGGLEPGTRVVVSDLSPAIEGMLINPAVDQAVEDRITRIAVPGASGPAPDKDGRRADAQENPAQ